MSIENIIQELNSLSPELQQEASDFISFLHSRQQKEKSLKPGKNLKLANEPFIGMWKDRKDMQDSSTWVKNIRKKEWLKQSYL